LDDPRRDDIERKPDHVEEGDSLEVFIRFWGTGRGKSSYRERNADCQLVRLQHKDEERSNGNKHGGTRPEKLEKDRV
jgi:hypothetical protein